MASLEDQDWNMGEKSGSVSIGSHKLFLNVTGPDRKAGEPVIIAMTGVTNTQASWAAVHHLTASFARLITYDRSGLGRSEPSPNQPSSTNIAAELRALLLAAHILPPYITVGHSWGGILTQEFLALDPDAISGMLFLDATQGHYPDLIPFTDPAIPALTQGLDWFDAIGLRESSALTPDEYAAFIAAEQDPSHAAQCAAEFAALMESYGTSLRLNFFNRASPVLGRRPVCVIKGHNDRDLRKAVEAGVAKGNGTETQRARCWELLSAWEEKEELVQREFMSLSKSSRWAVAGDEVGHFVHVVEPQAVVEGLRWILECLRG